MTVFETQLLSLSFFQQSGKLAPIYVLIQVYDPLHGMTKAN